MNSAVHRAWLSLGSNIEPRHHLALALAELRAEFGNIVVSPAYVMPAVGFEGADFINLAAGIDSRWDPTTLNQWLHALEDRHGRRRDVPRWSSRTLDVDIVLFDDLVMQGAGNLELPRGELAQAFVLKPLADIGADLRHPVTGQRIGEMWRAHAEFARQFAEIDLG